MSTVYLNGVYLARDEARISPFDRGFLFADAVYEVTAVYGGQLVDLERHLDRLERSLRELGWASTPERRDIAEAHRKLVRDNGVIEGYVYTQVSRGAYGVRDFPAPDTIRPTIFIYAESKPLIDTGSARNGSKVIVVDDIRWGRRDIKTVQLLYPVMAKTEAKAQGKDDAWLRAPDRTINEAAAANAWIVTREGEIITRSLSHAILAGITRHALFDTLSQKGRKITERAFTVEEAKAAAEAFTTAATGLVTPVVEIDGVAIGSGKPGPVVRELQRLYYTAIGADVGKAAPWLE